jgi:hypothetical protein
LTNTEPIRPAVPTIKSVWMMVSDLREEEAEDEAEEVLDGVTAYFRVRFGDSFTFARTATAFKPHRFAKP